MESKKTKGLTQKISTESGNEPGPAAVVWNWLLARPKAQSEADSLGSNIQVTRQSPKRESKIPAILRRSKESQIPTVRSKCRALERKTIPVPSKVKKESQKTQTVQAFKDPFITCKFLESVPQKDPTGKPTRFKVALIQEGLGNLKDAFYYTKACIENSNAAFEGKKCYADHPSATEEIVRPERSVRDIIGHFENVHTEANSDGSAKMVADLVVLPDDAFDWARSLITHAIDYSKSYPDLNFIGFSINAAGDAEAQDVQSFMQTNQIPDSCKPKLQQAIEMGVSEIRAVSAIHDAVSTDLVTEPGAKGKALEIIENNKEKTMPFPEKKDPKDSEDTNKKEDEGADPAASGGDHADADQDKELIMSMIKKHLGDDSSMDDEEECKQAQEAYESYKEMGHNEEEAGQLAAHAVKLARHKQSKMKQGEMEAGGEDMGKDKKETESTEKKETEAASSVEASVALKYEGRISFLEKELKKKSLAEFLDKKLKESKLGRAETDKIRSLIGEPKSEAHVNDSIKIFTEAFKMPKASSTSNIFATSVEKQAFNESTTSKVDFTSCTNKGEDY